MTRIEENSHLEIIETEDKAHLIYASVHNPGAIKWIRGKSMFEITPEKTHSLLEKLTSYVMNDVPKKSETDKLADYVMRELPTRQEVDGKIDKLAEYVMNEVPTKREMDERFGRVEKDIGEVKQNVNLILEGMGCTGQTGRDSQNRTGCVKIRAGKS